MPLDPKARLIIEQMDAAGIQPAHRLSIADARAALEARAALQAGSLEPVARVEEREIPGPGGPLRLRLYYPSDVRPLPVLVYFHGGGWIRGSLDTHEPGCRGVANAAGCLVVSVDYRLAPEAKFPALVEDAYTATRWVAEHGAEIGADPTRLAVGGDSAGGNLAAAVCLMARDRGGPPISFQLLVYPVIDHRFDRPSYRENAEGYVLFAADMEYYWRHYLADERDGSHPYASPIRAESLAGLPPALVITAEMDPLRDEGEAYAAKLKEAGVSVTCTRYDGMIHGFFGMASVLEQGRQGIQEAGQALRGAFECQSAPAEARSR